MADFIVGDYVEICHQPDRTWFDWTDDIHSHFCRKIGIVDGIEIDYTSPDDRSEDVVKVNAYISEPVFSNGPNWYFAFFKKRQLIKSSAEAYRRMMYTEEAAETTNHFEDFTKKKRDEIFRYIFGKESKEETKKSEEDNFSNDEKLMADWEEKTSTFA